MKSLTETLSFANFFQERMRAAEAHNFFASYWRYLTHLAVNNSALTILQQ